MAQSFSPGLDRLSEAISGVETSIVRGTYVGEMRQKMRMTEEERRVKMEAGKKFAEMIRKRPGIFNDPEKLAVLEETHGHDIQALQLFKKAEPTAHEKRTAFLGGRLMEIAKQLPTASEDERRMLQYESAIKSHELGIQNTIDVDGTPQGPLKFISLRALEVLASKSAGDLERKFKIFAVENRKTI